MGNLVNLDNIEISDLVDIPAVARSGGTRAGRRSPLLDKVREALTENHKALTFRCDNLADFDKFRNQISSSVNRKGAFDFPIRLRCDRDRGTVTVIRDDGKVARKNRKTEVVATAVSGAETLVADSLT